MSAEQSSSGNKINIKVLCRYAILTAVCLVFSYIESLVPLYFIAPGVKLGLSNAVALLLVCKNDIKGAFLVNVSRILLAALLFGSPVSLAFALSGGVVSLVFVSAFSKCRHLSAVGISIIGGVIHNAAQCLAASVFMSAGVYFYLPVLIAAGALSGGVIGALDLLILKKIKTNRFF